MGEMADYCLEQIEDFEEHYYSYKNGKMSDIDALEAGIIDENGYVVGSGSQNISRTCKHCGKNNLLWGKIEGKWKLFEGKIQHECKYFKFEKIERFIKNYRNKKCADSSVGRAKD